ESKKIAKNLILQEANNILMGIGLKEQFSFNDEVLKEINYRLNNLRRHQLSISSNKSTSTNEEIMEESDYEF
ncbi:MAG TPA: ribonucleoside-diphosphate reductase subunit beta, partial [Streptococcus sp.]|nr:ribonucleoside-diphosphate reductase subunit beta [Streptococcus sp.]